MRRLSALLSHVGKFNARKFARSSQFYAIASKTIPLHIRARAHHKSVYQDPLICFWGSQKLLSRWCIAFKTDIWPKDRLGPSRYGHRCVRDYQTAFDLIVFNQLSWNNVAIAGSLITSILIFDILTDPIIGYLSDRTVSRWGRRAPWMAIGALLLALGQIGIFGVPNFD